MLASQTHLFEGCLQCTVCPCAWLGVWCVNNCKCPMMEALSQGKFYLVGCLPDHLHRAKMFLNYWFFWFEAWACALTSCLSQMSWWLLSQFMHSYFWYTCFNSLCKLGSGQQIWKVVGQTGFFALDCNTEDPMLPPLCLERTPFQY